MARVQVGIIADRDEKGNFLPARPLYREIPDEEYKRMKNSFWLGGRIPLSKEAEQDIYELFADLFKAHRRAMREAGLTPQTKGAKK